MICFVSTLMIVLYFIVTDASCQPIIPVDEIIAAGTGGNIGTSVSVTVTAVTVLSVTSATVTSVTATSSAAVVTSSAASAGAASAAGASGSSSAFGALGASPQLTAFLMIGMTMNY